MTERSGGRSARVVAFAIGRGALAFAVIAAIAEILAFGVWAFAGIGISLADALSLGWLEIGAVHHVALHLEIRDVVTPAASRIDVTVGIALASATLVALWLLARAGRAAADVAGGGPGRRLGAGALVAVAYAVPCVALLPFVDVETAAASDAIATSVFRLSAVTWQAVAFPFVVALLGGVAGGVRSMLGARPDDDRMRARSETALRAGGRMLALAFVATFAGLFVGGVVDPDGPIAVTTPTTARYVRLVADRPSTGVVAVAHHVGVAPVEATWAFVPAMGGCVTVTGSADGDLLCYGRFPAGIEGGDASAEALALPLGEVGFDAAPLPYLAFLLAPAIATIGGGFLAGRSVADPRANRREGLVRAVLAGSVFALGVAAMSVLSTVSVTFRSDVAGELSQGAFAAGPDPLAALALGLVWGVAGGALGSWLSRQGSSRSRTARPAPG